MYVKLLTKIPNRLVRPQGTPFCRSSPGTKWGGLKWGGRHGCTSPSHTPSPWSTLQKAAAESSQRCVPAHCSTSPACLPGLKSSISNEDICGSPSALAGRGLGSEPNNPEWLMLLSTGHDQCQVHSLYILPHLCLTTPSKVGFLKTKLDLIEESNLQYSKQN